MTVVMAMILAGCGGGSSSPGSSTSSTGSSSSGSLPNSLQVGVRFAPPPVAAKSAREVAAGFPDDSSAVVVHLLFPTTGRDAIPPVTQAHAPGTSEQTIVVGNVPSGQFQLLVWAIDAGGQPTLYAARPVSIAGGPTLVVIDSASSLTSVNVTPAQATILAGTHQAYAAAAALDDGSNANVSGLASYDSSDATVASIDADGIATALHNGSTSIRATFNGTHGTAALTVTNELASLLIAPPSSTVTAGFSVQLTATGTFNDGATQDLTSAVTWTSSNPTVATVSPTGLARGMAVGDSTLGAAIAGQTAQAALHVTDAVLVSITVTPAGGTVPKGATLQLTASGTFSDGATTDLSSQVTWTSSPTGIASIASSGLATGLSVGSTTVTASLGAIMGTAGLTVSPAEIVSVAVSPGVAMSSVATTRQFRALATFTDGTQSDVSPSASWSLTGGSNITIDPGSGLVTLDANASGTATVTATTANNISSSASLSVGSFYYYATSNSASLLMGYGVPTSNTTVFTEVNASTVPGLPRSIALNPSGATLYAAVAGGNVITALPITVTPGAGQGAPGTTPLSSTTVPFFASGLGVLPDGSALVAAGIRSVNDSGFKVFAAAPNGAVGAQLADFPSAADAAGLTIDPLNRYVFLTEAPHNANITTIDAFPVSTTGFQSTLTAPVQTAVNHIGKLPTATAIHPSGQFVYTAAPDGLNVLSINPSSGAATVAQRILDGTNLRGIAVHPTGNRLYVTDGSSLTSWQLTSGMISGPPSITGVSPFGCVSLRVNAAGTVMLWNIDGVNVRNLNLNPVNGTVTSTGAVYSFPSQNFLDIFSP